MVYFPITQRYVVGGEAARIRQQLMPIRTNNRRDTGFFEPNTRSVTSSTYLVSASVPVVHSSVAMVDLAACADMPARCSGQTGYVRNSENSDYTVGGADNCWSLAVGPGLKDSRGLVSSYVGFLPFAAGIQESECGFAAPPSPVLAPPSTGIGAVPMTLWAAIHTGSARCVDFSGIGSGGDVFSTASHHQHEIA